MNHRRLILAVVVAASAYPVSAQPVVSVASTASASSAWQPPTMTFPGERITLMEAVRLTLANDPNLRLQEQRAIQSRATFQIQSGAFDPVLSGTAAWLHTEDALTFSEFSSEFRNRQDLERDADAEVSRQEQLQRDIVDIDSQIAASTDPVEIALLRDRRADKVQTIQDSKVSEADLRQRRANLGDIPRIKQRNSINLGVDLTLPYRDGVTPGLFAKGSWDENRFKGKPKDPDFGGQGPDTWRLEVGFKLDVKILRGRGRDATGAAEESSRIDWEASQFALKHQASTSVLQTITAYWNLVAAQEILDTTLKQTKVHQRRLELTDALIAGDELPRAERSRVLASQAQDEGLVANAARQVSEARVELARTIGLNVAEAANAPLASDTFPSLPDRAVLSAAVPAGLIDTALGERQDRMAFLRLRDSGGVLLRQAQTALRTRLDFKGSISATSVAEASASQTSNGWAAPSASLSLELERPIGNNAAKGRLLQSQADYNIRSIDAADLDRSIRTNVVQILFSIQQSALQLEKAGEAVRLYEQTVATENERFRAGESTILDSLVTQDFQTSALFTYTQVRQQLAVLMARLRFETGTLVATRGDVNVVRASDIAALPTPSRPAN